MESSRTENLSPKSSNPNRLFEDDVSGINEYVKGAKCQPSWNDIICKYLDYIYEMLIKKNLDYGKKAIMRKGKQHGINYVIDQLFSKMERIDKLFERTDYREIKKSIEDVIGYAVILKTLIDDEFEYKTNVIVRRSKDEPVVNPNSDYNIGIDRSID